MRHTREPSQPSAISDADLLDRVRRRDEAALVIFYDRYGGLVMTVALRILGDRELAEEVMQDTFLRCWTGAETYRPQRGHVAGWLMGISRNRAIDVLRSRPHRARVREQTELPDPDSTGAPREPDAADDVVGRDAVASAMGELTAAQRRVIELAYYGGFTQVEIATLLDEPLGTVKTRTRAAMDRLRTTLRPLFAAGDG